MVDDCRVEVVGMGMGLGIGPWLFLLANAQMMQISLLNKCLIWAAVIFELIHVLESIAMHIDSLLA